tara:strand:- start:480 stop:932 length:453 start_codon:yes stop_codon:yes gene_type:complete
MRITINNQNPFYIEQPKNVNIPLDIFNHFIEKSKEFIINDDGEVAETKEALKKFDISKDKEFGNDWHFIVNKDSRELIKKTIKAYDDWGHMWWILKNNNFEIKFVECGDEEFQLDGPSGNKTVFYYFVIKCDDKIEKEIRKILDKYNTKF